ncbi:hypothetical protein Glove_130g137 [Diversispora epigaea]|uniref:Uncharacterized protein n=1 Tax=Diversispora epigaea TaxID=1348612 RepID=A0A397IY77_9GLOM|nr:hypothetical protein Glove_130g137 [Diversispora epigaea]
MTNTHITPGKLIIANVIVPELHYGPYLRDWWIFSKGEIQENTCYPIPIRLGLKIMIQLNNNPFIIHIVRHIHSPLQPGYICEGRGQSSSVAESASAAITSVYQLVFGTRTKYAGLSYLGLEQAETVQKLLEGVTFRPFIIEIENFSVFISWFDVKTKLNRNKIDQKYSASLFYKYKKKQSVFFQQANKNLFSITIYQVSQVVTKFEDFSPNAVWHQTQVLKSIPGDILFARNHSITLQKLNQLQQILLLQIPNECTIVDWNNQEIMKHLFRLHLKKAVRGSYEEWNKIFQSWIQQKSNIIELYTHIEKTYNSNYKYTERELRAWRAIFCAAGCTNITPFDNKISKNEFWTNAPDPEKDCETLMNLYTEGFLNIHQPYCLLTETISENVDIDDKSTKTKFDDTDIFWNCFRDSYNINFRGREGKIRIVSIIAEKFTYQEIINKLKVSPNTINAA